jgi:hypothetical protein
VLGDSICTVVSQDSEPATYYLFFIRQLVMIEIYQTLAANNFSLTLIRVLQKIIQGAELAE